MDWEAEELMYALEEHPNSTQKIPPYLNRDLKWWLSCCEATTLIAAMLGCFSELNEKIKLNIKSLYGHKFCQLHVLGAAGVCVDWIELSIVDGKYISGILNQLIQRECKSTQVNKKYLLVTHVRKKYLVIFLSLVKENLEEAFVKIRQTTYFHPFIHAFIFCATLPVKLCQSSKKEKTSHQRIHQSPTQKKKVQLILIKSRKLQPSWRQTLRLLLLKLKRTWFPWKLLRQTPG